MIATKVRVVSNHDGELLVESLEQSGCVGCGSRSVCGVSGLARHFSGNRKPVALSCYADARAGEEMQLQMSESDLLKAGLIAYLVPSVFALAGAALMSLSGQGDVMAALGAFAGVLLGLLLMRAFNWMPRVSPISNQSFNEGENT